MTPSVSNSASRTLIQTPLRLADDILKDEHFRRLATYIESETGIRLPEAKKTMVEGRLRPRARAKGLQSLAEYGNFLFSGGGLASEFAAIVDCVTTNKTDFFRENEHFEFLKNRLVPGLLSSGRGTARSPLKFWSAAASTGAEAYTLAMVLADVQTAQACEVSILATDISTDILAKAQRGIYGMDMMSPIPELFRKRYTMSAIDSGRQEFRIVPELRQMVRFKPLNLTARSYEVERDFDVIFCRNVLIYFQKDVQRAVVERLTSHLRPGGFLMLGHSEAMPGSEHPGLSQIIPTVFQLQGGVR